jgi:hypothetical protein
MENNPSWLLPLLPSRATGALLALLYLHPDRDYTLAEAGRLIAASPKVMHTEANRLVTAGLIRETRRGRARLLRAESAAPVSRPLTDLLAVTYGPLPVLTDLLSEVEGVAQAYIYMVLGRLDTLASRVPFRKMSMCSPSAPQATMICTTRLARRSFALGEK